MEELPTISFIPVRETESGSPFFGFEARLSAPSSADITFSARTIGGTATPADDLLGLTSGRFTIPAGTTSLVVDQRVRNDSLNEGDESFFLRISDVDGAVLPRGAATTDVLGIILEDDGDSRPALFVTDTEIVEGNGGGRQAVFGIALSRPFDTAVEIPFETVGITATAGEDFAPRTGVVRFAPGETETTVSVPVTPDAVVEQSESFALALDVSGLGQTLANGADGAVGTATILDDDAGGGALPVLSVANARLSEASAGFMIFELRLSAPTSSEVRVDVRTLEGTADAPFDLLGLTADEIVIPPGETTVEVAQRLRDDSDPEPDESFYLSLANVTGAVFEGGAQDLRVRGIILDDRTGGIQPSLFVDDATVVEGATGTREAVFGIALSRPSDETLSFDYRTVPLGAAGGQDFAPVSGTVTFLPGQTEAAVAVDVFGDTAAEASESFALVLDTGGAALGNGAAQAAGIGTILDDDSGGGTLPVLTVSDIDSVERSAPFLGYEFRLSAPSTQDVTFDVLTLNGTALAAADLLGLTSDSLTIPAGDTLARVFQRIRDDGVREGDEDIGLAVTNLSGAVFEGGLLEERAIGVLRDIDGENRPAFVVEDARVVEGGAGTRSVQLDVLMTRPLDEPVTVTYTTAPREGADLGDLAGRTGQLVFAPGETLKTVSFAVRGDTEIEPTGTIELIVVPETAGDFSDGGNGAVGTVRLLDDDAGGGTLPVITVDAASQTEQGASFMPFEIRLSAPSSTEVSFDARILSDTISIDTDLLGLVDERIAIPAGETAVTVFQRLRDDSTAEETETLFLQLSNPTGAVFEGGADQLRATGTVIDDDGGSGSLTALLVDDPVIEEPDGGTATMVFEVRSPTPAGLTISGSYEVFAGTAAPGSDFTPMAGDFSIASGQTTARIEVPVFGDDVAEPAESVVLRVFDIANAGTGNRSGEIFAIGTIDDGPYAADDAGTAFTRTATLIDVLGNDRGGDGGALSVESVGGASNGVAGLTSDGEIVYRGRGGFEGEDSFVYTVVDEAGRTDTATVRVSVSAEQPREGVSTAEAQTIAYLYEAGLDRDGNIDEPGLNFWIGAREGGFSRARIADAFIDSDEFAAAFGDPDSLSDETFVTALYENVLDRDADAPGLAFWLSVLDDPAVDRAGLLLAFAGSPENLTGSPSVATLALGDDGDWMFA